jgi:fimbrial chaperone protein
MTRSLIGLVLVCTGLFSFSPRQAQASAFDVSPVTLTLTAQATSGMITVTNRGTEPMRFHVSAFSWQQKGSGEMVLNPTNEVVFFPAMLTLNPKEARNLRVGVNIKPGAVEKTYRVFVQELPPAVTSENPGVVRVLTKMGIPVFVQPTAAPTAKPVLSELAVQGHQITFKLTNAGNRHLRLQKLLVSATNNGKVLHTKEIDPWYVLAGGTHTYAVELPVDVCKALKSVHVELESDSGAAKASLADAHCVP